MISKVSVVVPVYNVEKYIGACIESLLNQTLEEIEIILVNDASPDESLNILRSYESRYPDKIVVIDSKKNRKQGGARNLGMQAAHGEFIGFVDGDDIVYKDMYQVLLNRIQETGADFVSSKIARVPRNATISNIKRDELQSDTIWREEILALDNKELTDNEREKLMAFGTGSICLKLFRTEWIMKHKLFFPEQLTYEDNYWDTMMCSYVRKFSLIDQIMYYYRGNPDSTVNKSGNYHLDRIKIEEDLYRDMETNGNGEKYHDALECICAVRYFSNTFWHVAAKTKPMPWKHIKHQKQYLKNKFPNFRNNKYLQSLPKKAYVRVLLPYYCPRSCYLLVRMYMFAKYLRDLLR